MTNRKIFILDDDKAILELLKQHFTDRQFEVDATSLIVEAKEKLSSSTYSVSILDLGLSVIDHTDGLDLVKFIRKRSPRTGIIVYTGNDNQDVKYLALSLGADFYVLKPSSLSYLEGIVSVLCHR